MRVIALIVRAARSRSQRASSSRSSSTAPTLRPRSPRRARAPRTGPPSRRSRSRSRRGRRRDAEDPARRRHHRRDRRHRDGLDAELLPPTAAGRSPTSRRTSPATSSSANSRGDARPAEARSAVPGARTATRSRRRRRTRWLVAAGFTVMNSANNHAFDYGESSGRRSRRSGGPGPAHGSARPGYGAEGRAYPRCARRLRLVPVGCVPYGRPQREAARRHGKKRSADVVIVTVHAGAEGDGPPARSSRCRALPRRESAATSPGSRTPSSMPGRTRRRPRLARPAGHGGYKGLLIAYSLGNFAGQARSSPWAGRSRRARSCA